MSLLKKRAAVGDTLEHVWHVRVPDYVVAVEAHPPSNTCFALTGGGELLSLSLADGDVRWIQEAHATGANHLAVLEDGSVVATGGQDNTLRTWRADDGEAIGLLKTGMAWPERILAARGASRFFVGAGKRLLAVTPAAELEREVGVHQASIADMVWHPFKPRFLSASYGEVKLWDASTLTQLKCLEWKGSILKIAMSPNGRILATGNQDATVHFWRLQAGGDSQMWGYPRKVRELSWSNDSRYLAVGGGPGVTVWDFSGKGPENTRPTELSSLGAPLTVLEYEREGNFLAGGTEHGHVFVWHPGKRDSVVGLEMVTGAVSCLSWLPDR
ncbi:MAG: hypothetical protein MUF01_13445, partial [Bryobacterales bacterium]|nr:hypothetical protein [Bryobacterales bacterium]